MTTLKKEKSNKMHERTTKCICHKGISGYSSDIARPEFRIGGQGTAPQSLNDPIKLNFIHRLKTII